MSDDHGLPECKYALVQPLLVSTEQFARMILIWGKEAPCMYVACATQD